MCLSCLMRLLCLLCLALPTTAFMGNTDVAHAYVDFELGEEQGYMGRLGLDDQVDEHTHAQHSQARSSGPCVCEQLFVSNTDGPTQAEAPQLDNDLARERTHDGITDIVEGTLAAAYRALLWAAETLLRRSMRWRTWSATRGLGTCRTQVPTAKAPKDRQARFKERLRLLPSLFPRPHR